MTTREWLGVTMLALVACGPTCPPLYAHRADLPPDLESDERRLALDANVVAAVNGRPAALRFRVLGVEPVSRRFTVYRWRGGPLLDLEIAPEPDGSYLLGLEDPSGAPLESGVHRVRVETPDLLEASFEIRECAVFY
ncbi:hypothetical protein [Sandaracinus amylolyticus]|uniref:hypothetical protein n=1 Tax=Sandaracinus amylolyticus TaxID=927083 RepID=UPI001F2926C9|nr:hypothetical protein [Sandaracinus amylolyticus]UJR87293.1 Hypothetical protein I5071_850 [Sandaracinus amylolyticus]